MTQEKDPKSPATTSSAYDCMAPRWRVIESLLGGTESMRAAGELYLPKHVEESDKGYQERLQAAVLLNMVEQTLDTPSKTLIWMIPRSAATYTIDKGDRTFTRTGVDEPTDRVLVHMGFTVKEIQ